MDYKIVYRSLTEMFPQIDARLLKAVAIEHPKNVVEAADVVISDIIPSLYPNLADKYIQSKATESRVVSSDSIAFVQAESGTSDISGSSKTDEISLRLRSVSGSLYDVKEVPSDAELSRSNLVDETSKGDPDAFSFIVKGTTQGCSIDHLEHIIEDARRNKRNLRGVMESVMNLMREVELEEKETEKVMEDAIEQVTNTLERIEELKKMVAYSMERNDMDAGEVYGERSILTTEVLLSRFLSLSEERNQSLSVLDEIRGALKMRQAAALGIKNVAEQRKQEKEASSRKALAEQEAIMEKLVQESKLVQQEVAAYVSENKGLKASNLELQKTVVALRVHNAELAKKGKDDERKRMKKEMKKLRIQRVKNLIT